MPDNPWGKPTPEPEPDTERMFSQWPHVAYRVGRFGSDGYGFGEQESDREVVPLAEANVVTSEIPAGGVNAGLHTIALDIDLPTVLVPSSTPGHYHLYIDIPPQPWERIGELLEALAKVGVVEPGYAAVSNRRRHTALRTPWTHKAKPVPPADEPPF